MKASKAACSFSMRSRQDTLRWHVREVIVLGSSLQACETGVSNAAPHLAVPMADRPATPPPMTSILAGGTRPAAVICPVKKRPKWLAASMTALAACAPTSVD